MGAAAGPLIALCAGEASGDQLGAALMRDIRAQRPDVRFVGIGGPLMREAGLDCWFDAQELAVMGLVEVLRHLPRLLRLRRQFVARLVAAAPAVYVGIDAPDFNLGIERRLRSHRVRTLHYVSPSIWAWRQQRARTIGLSADRVLCLFPFEPALYAKFGVDARFVGHPFADQMPLEPNQASARAGLDLATDAQVLAVLPGSRGGEIARLGSDFLATAVQFVAQNSERQALVAAASPAVALRLRALLATQPASATARIRVIEGQVREVLAACDLALVASGTATLEVALSKRPMVVAYRIAALTYWIVRVFGLLKVQHYSLPNVLTGHGIVPEISQDQVCVATLSPALERWLDHPEAVRALQAEFLAVHEQLRQGASKQAAQAVLECLPA